MVGPVMGGAQSALARLTAAIGQQWVSLMWEAARLAVGCQAKATAAADALLSRARQVYEDTGAEVELASFNVLGSAYELALQQGCSPVAPGELAGAAAVAPAPFGPLPMPAPAPASFTTDAPAVEPSDTGGVRPGLLPPLPVLVPPDFDLPGVAGPAAGGPGVVLPEPEPAPAPGMVVAPGLPGPVQVIPLPVFGLFPIPVVPPGGVAPPFPGPMPGPAAPGAGVPPFGPFPPPRIGQPVPLPPLVPPPRPPFVFPNPGDNPPLIPVPGPPGGPPAAPGPQPALPPPQPPAGPGACPTPVQVSVSELIKLLCPTGAPKEAPKNGQPPATEPPAGTEPFVPPEEVIAAPAPPAEEEPIDALHSVRLRWESSKFCAETEQWLVEAITEGKKAQRRLVEGDPLTESAKIEEKAKEATKDLPAVVRQVAGFLLTGVLELLELWAGAAGGLSPCIGPVAGGITGLRALVDLLEKWLGAGLGGLKAELKRIDDYLCPTDIPSFAEAVDLYQADQMSFDQLVCLARANNRTPESAGWNARAGHSLPDVREMIALYLRGYYDQPGGNVLPLQRLEADLRRRGHADERLAQWLELARFVPGPGDLVRFMVRDVFDPSVVEKYGYDSEFKEKFTGPALAWARAQGMEEDQFRFYWRAHWQLPGAGQGYEMLHRLRPGRVDEAVVTTADDVAKLLAVNDTPEYWARRLMAISYRPLRLVDLRNAYFRGVVDDKELNEQLQDRGYDRRNADIVTRYFQRAKVDYWLGRPIGKQFLQGLVHLAQLRRRLSEEGLSGELLERVVRELQDRRDDLARQQCAREIRQRYLAHKIEDYEAHTELQAAGFGLENAVELVRAWGCQRPRIDKEESAAQLCKSVELGLVPLDEATRRLIKMGYSRGAASNIMDQCAVAIRTRLAARQERALKAAQAASQRQQKEAEKQARQVAQTAKQVQAQQAKDKRAAEKREKQIAKLATLAAKTSRRPADSEREAIDLAHREFAARERVSLEAALELIEQAIGQAAQEEGRTWLSVLESLGHDIPPLG